MIEKLTAVVEAQTRKFKKQMDKVNDMMRRMRDHHTVEVDAEIADFQRRVREAEQQMDSFLRRHERNRVDLDADADPLTRAVRMARQKLREIPQRINTYFTGDNNPLTSSVARAKAGLRSIAQRVTTVIAGNPTPLGRAVIVARTALSSISQRVTSIIAGNASPLVSTVAVARTALSSIAQRVTTMIAGNASNLNSSVAAARAALASLPNRVTTILNASSAALIRAVTVARAALASLPNTVVIRIMDIWGGFEDRLDKFENAMNRLSKITNSISNVMGNALRGGLLALLPAIAPALSGAVGVIGAIGPMIGSATSGLMGLVSAFSTAGTGAVAFGALAVTSIGSVIKTGQDLDKLQAKLDDATNAKERAKIMEKIKVLQESLGKEEKKALATLEDFKDNWQDIAKITQKPILKSFTNSLTTFKTVLNSLRPMFVNVANGAVTLTKNLDNAFKAKDMQNFIKWMNNNAGKAFVTFGNIAGNVMRTVMNLIVAFGPLGNDMAASMEKATASWAKWAAGLSSSQRFQDFISYTRENGPKLLQVITNFSGALRRLFAAFGPMSADMLTSLVDMTARFREWAGSVQHTEGFKNFIAYIEKTGPTVWSTLGQISRTIINLLVGMAPLGKTILETVNSFLKFSNAAMEANPAIGQFIAAGLSLIGVVRAIVPAMVAVSSLTNGFKDFMVAARWISSFKNSLIAVKLLSFVNQLKTTILVMGQFIARNALMATQATVNGARMAVAWTAMKISSLITSLKNGIIQMGLWIKNMTLMAAQSVAQATRMAVAWTAAKISSFILMLQNGIRQMILWVTQMALMATQSIANATRMAAAWTATKMSSFILMLQNGIKQMALFIARMAVMAAQAMANAVRMAAAWVVAMGPIGWITTAVIGIVALIIANWDKVKAFTIKAWGAISNFLKGLWEGIKKVASSVWGGIKGFITGVWNGIKKAATTIWNGIKTYFTTVFKIYKTIFTTVWNTIKKVVTAVWNGLKNTASSVWNGIKSFFSTVLGGIKNFFVNNWNKIKSTTTTVFNTVKTFIGNVWNKIKTTVGNVVGGIWKAVSGKFNDIKNTVGSKMNDVKSKIKSIWDKVMAFFRGIDLFKIGKDIIRGLIRGIGGVAGDLYKKASDIVGNVKNTFTKLFNIHSPSRWMRDEIGYNLGAGMAVGLDRSTNTVVSSAKKTTQAAQKASQAEMKKAQKQAQKQAAALKKKQAAAARKANARRKTGIDNKIRAVETKFDTGKISSKTYIKQLNAIKKKNKLTSTQNAKIQREIYNAQKKTQSQQKKKALEAQRKKAKAQLAYQKKVSQKIASAEVKYDTKKISGQTYMKQLEKIKKKEKLTAAQRNKVQKEIYATRTKLQKEAQKKKDDERKAADKLNKGLLSANNSYLSKFKSINDKLTSDIKKANEEYKSALKDRTDSIYNAMGLFDSVTTQKVSGSKLLNNLQAQIDRMKGFQSDLSKLSSNAPKEFVDELRQMGVGSADQIKAIAAMSEPELDKYISLWKQKHNMASEQATKELAGLKNETTKKIAELRSAANTELNKLKVDYMNKISQLTVNVKQLGSLKKSGQAIGYNTMSGIISGMKGMKGELAKEANAIAASIEKTIKKKLKIHSPSRLMRDQVGVMVPAGIAVGIQQGVGTVSKAMNAVTDAMYIKQEDLNIAYDASITNSKIGAVKHELSAELQNIELPEQMIVIEMDGKKVGQGVAKPVENEQKRANARRTRIT
ncbi:phage tail protein [Bacillus safensis]